ncbi:hypothetical protein D3C73_1006840 [compost metagenome]
MPGSSFRNLADSLSSLACRLSVAATRPRLSIRSTATRVRRYMIWSRMDLIMSDSLRVMFSDSGWKMMMLSLSSLRMCSLVGSTTRLPPMVNGLYCPPPMERLR